jgi:hypothetical protein
MLWQHRKLTADDLARDFAVSAQTFADTFIQYVAPPNVGEDAAVVARRHFESCALVWALIKATFIASALTLDECAKVVPLVRDLLIPNWRKYYPDGRFSIDDIRARAADYLRHQNPLSQLKTATAFMYELVASLDEDGARLLPVKTLTAILAHRMLSDLRRLNEIKAGHSII